jgi:nicotinate-nucleotide adenylyltransferase
MAKIGLYFGSFNPIHIGHTAIAGSMLEFTDIDQVWFIVSPHNPLKDKGSLLDDHQRLYMVQLTVEKNLKLRSSDIEFKLPKPSYTIDTLTYLKDKYRNNEFCLIMGEDNLYTLDKWKNVRELISGYSIYVYPRPLPKKTLSHLLEDILSSADIHRVPAPYIDISSTFIRDGIKKGKDMSYFLNPDVWKYIQDMHFYEK